MKKQSALVVAVVLSVGLGLAMVASHGLRGALIVKQADAAYRDGAYQAKIDVERGRKAHVSSGRWSTDQDRASFIAGYEESFKALAEAKSGKSEPTAAEVAGYRDGVSDGARHRRAAQPFQLSKTENYLRPESGAGYRDAYSNGYQEGYYLPQESAELKTISQN
ncbi:MAG TPA: hypothetical protein VLL05_17250 [Terriglobales bacterium]|nr:hypothetical protein [Terriglobales bacterium]